jgi:sec1 family domain-containing protein 1
LGTLFERIELCAYDINQSYNLEDDDDYRIPSPDQPAIYFLKPTIRNVEMIISDASISRYKSFHCCFSSPIPYYLARYLASQPSGHSTIHVHNNHFLEFVTLWEDLFFLVPDNPKSFSLQLNDPTATPSDIDLVIDRIATGLFSVLSTLDVVPFITCPPGGDAHKVASLLDQRLRHHLQLLGHTNSLFSDSNRRPLLCLFDRNFELSVAIQHDFRYAPLVQDVFAPTSNRVTVQGQTIALEGDDFFWTANGSADFSAIAAKLDALAIKYIHDAQQPCTHDWIHSLKCPPPLPDVMARMPDLLALKYLTNIHTDIENALRFEVTQRSLDYFARKECQMMLRGGGGGIDFDDLLDALRIKGNKMDRLRFAIMFLLSADSIPQLQVDQVESALQDSEIDTSAFQYVKKLKSLNAALVKNRDHDKSSAMAEMVEALMEGPEIESGYLMFDPKSNSAAAASPNKKGGTFKDAIVFVVGGGNYAEYEYLQELAKRGQQPGKRIIYGSTEILSGGEFVEQLTLLR